MICCYKILVVGNKNVELFRQTLFLLSMCSVGFGTFLTTLGFRVPMEIMQ